MVTTFRITSVWVLFAAVVSLCTACREQDREASLSPREALGRLIFFDGSLSEPSGQSCATCHEPERGYADRDGRAVSEGAVAGLFGNRNAMTIAYSCYVPPLHYDSTEATYVGGLFWDGRIATVEAQSCEPLLNPVEMGNSSAADVAAKIRRAPYYGELTRLYGEISNPDSLLGCVADALGAYERSREINRFSSKYDAWEQGLCALTDDEAAGLELFRGRGLCAECHILDPDPTAGRVLFTDYTYDNLGIPRNADNPYYRLPARFNPDGPDAVDTGLGAVVKDSAENGKFRVPTLRNVALTAPYGHNGYFAMLEEIVHFYNVRDTGHEFPPAEYPATVNTEELGDLKLTPDEERQIVCFLQTLTDGFAVGDTPEK